MGCDGGTIPRRDELVKNKKKQEERDKDADLAGKWQYCALSSTRLRPPIVSCELGRLYNKEAVIEFLLKRDSDVSDHIRSLKDVIELKLTQKNDFPAETGLGGESADRQDSPFICPVVGLEMNGKYRFCYIRRCGCVLSERALKEVKSENCHRCASPFDPDQDVVVLNASEEEVEQMRLTMTGRRAKAKAEKRDKKRKNTESNDDTIRLKEGTPAAASSTSSRDRNQMPSSSGTRPASERVEKKGCVIGNGPNSSEAYKSLFTSHESAKKKPKSNWVTYNPLYF